MKVTVSNKQSVLELNIHFMLGNLGSFLSLFVSRIMSFFTEAQKYQGSYHTKSMMA